MIALVFLVCKLVITENILGGQLPPLQVCPPLGLWAAGYHHSVYDIFSARLPVNTDYVNTNVKNYHTHSYCALQVSSTGTLV